MAVIHNLSAILLIWTCVVAARNTELYDASVRGDITEVKRILGNNCTTDVNKPSGNNKWTPLFVAASNNHYKVAASLLYCDAEPNVWTYDPNDKSHHHLTPMMSASRSGYIKMVNLLISVNAELDLQKGDGWTALMLASRGNPDPKVDMALRKDYLDVVNALVCAEADPDIRNNIDGGWTALMHASYNGHPHVVKALLSAGAKTDIKNSEGETALMMASKSNFLGIVMELIYHGADTTITNNDGNTAEDIARRFNHGQGIEIIQNTRRKEVCK